MTDVHKYTSKLVDKRILIIGGSSGIGFAVAEACLEYGATVFVSSSSQSRIDSSVAELQKSYPSAKSRISGQACDLSSTNLEDNIERLFAYCGPKKLDHVIITAGDRLAITKVEDMTLENVQKAGQIRFFAPLLVTKHAIKHLNPGPASSITLTTGSVGEKPIKDWTVVASFASGLHGMVRGLALDLEPLRINLISPGAVITPLWDPFSDVQKEELFEETAARMTTGQVGRVEDVAESYLYAMRDSNVTGSIISTNGGYFLK